MKKVLLISHSNMSLSGVPVVYMSIVRNLYKDYQFDIIITKDNDMYFEKEFLSYGGDIYKFNCPKPTKLFPKIWWLLYTYKKNVKKFLRTRLTIKDYSVVHSFNEGYSLPFFKEAKRAGIKTILLHINSASSAYPDKHNLKIYLYRRYQEKAEKYCSNIIFVNKQSLLYHNYKNKGIVLYNTYDEKVFNHIIESKTNNLILTQVATFNERKNQLFSLQVIKEIKKELQNVQINFVGAENENGYLNKINKYIADNNLFADVQFFNGDIDKIKVFEDTSFFLLPSTTESFGIVLIEAQACGIHCFANKGLPHDTDLGNVDFIELNAHAWAKTIISYYKKYGNSRKQPLNMEQFSTQQFINKIKALYE